MRKYHATPREQPQIAIEIGAKIRDGPALDLGELDDAKHLQQQREASAASQRERQYRLIGSTFTRASGLEARRFRREI